MKRDTSPEQTESAWEAARKAEARAREAWNAVLNELPVTSPVWRAWKELDAAARTASEVASAEEDMRWAERDRVRRDMLREALPSVAEALRTADVASEQLKPVTSASEQPVALDEAISAVKEVVASTQVALDVVYALLSGGWRHSFRWERPKVEAALWAVNSLAIQLSFIPHAGTLFEMWDEQQARNQEEYFEMMAELAESEEEWTDDRDPPFPSSGLMP